MNKRYIDFVPTNKPVQKTSSANIKRQSTVRQKPAPKSTPEVIYSRPQVKKPVVRHEASVSRNNSVQLGVVEDLGAKNKQNTVVEKPVENSQPKSGRVFKVPKTPFINQEKVVKRPLSKNTYQKKIVVPKEEPKGPVTIITKPEKDAHVSMVVAVILTIILGAAAGTVAFLLLPK